MLSHTHTHVRQNETDTVPRVQVRRAFYLITGVERSQQHHGACGRTINVLVFGFQSRGAKESEGKGQQQKNWNRMREVSRVTRLGPSRTVWEPPTVPTLSLRLIVSSLKHDRGGSPVPEVTDEVWVVHLHLLC